MCRPAAIEIERATPLRGRTSADHGGPTDRSSSPQEPIARGVTSSNYEGTALSRQIDMMPVSTSLPSPLSNTFSGRFGSALQQFLTRKFLPDISSLISQQWISARNRGCFRFPHNRAQFQRLTDELFGAPCYQHSESSPFSYFHPFSLGRSPPVRERIQPCIQGRILPIYPSNSIPPSASSEC
jgi:hypothetical protein